MDSRIQKDQRELLEYLMQMIPFGIIFVRDKKHIDYHNDRFVEIFGYHHRKLTDLSGWFDIAFPDADYRRQLRGILLYEIPYTQTGNQRIYTAAMVSPLKEEKLIQFTSIRLADDQFLILCEDVTEARKLEARLQLAQKQEAIGSMAGGVAHDINNILMGIQGYISLMLLETPSSDKHYVGLKAIEEQVNCGSDLTEQLLECARGGRLETKTIELNEFVAGITEPFSRLHRDLHLNERFSTYVWAVEADAAQLAQAFQNIFATASNIPPGKGSLLLKTDNIMLDSGHAAMYNIKSGPYVRVSLNIPDVSLDPSAKAQLFSPSSMIKDTGFNASPGLASAYGVIKSHGGFIEVACDSLTGTAFDVYLPASSKTPHKKKPEFSATRTRTGNETILLVDDEKVITEVTGAMLTALGYEVLIASDGEEAVAIYQEMGKRIDLVIMDVVMPGMGGGEAIDLIREINPGVKVILCSGYSMSGAVKAIMDKGVQTFLKKPFKMTDFSLKIREVLES